MRAIWFLLFVNYSISEPVLKFETLSQIAAKYSVSTSKLRQANSIKGDVIRVGQVLRIPHS